MKIVIVGSGKMGSYLSFILAKENYDVTIIDKKEQVLNKLNNTQDVSTLCGNGLVANTLIEADVNHADILIATMKNDEDNIVCCLLAKNLGVKSTIMRIRNPEYYKTMQYIQNDLGLSMAINPELLTAREIANDLRLPSSIKTNYFSKGKIEMIEFKIKDDSKLIGLSVQELIKKIKSEIIIFAVERNNEVYIPNGDFIFELGDKLVITSTHQNISNFIKKVGNISQKAKNVMIVGGSKVSYYLSMLLCNMNVGVKLIELDKEKCVTLSENIPKALIINGDGSDKQLLLEEGIEDVDAFISATGIDEENIIFSMYANSIKVPKVVTKINHLTFGELIEDIGIESVLTPHVVASNQVLRYIRAKENSKGGSMETLIKILNNKLEIMEFIVDKDFKANGKQLKDIKFKNNVIIVCIKRNKNIIFPTGEDIINTNDNIIVATTKFNIKGLNDILM